MGPSRSTKGVTRHSVVVSGAGLRLHERDETVELLPFVPATYDGGRAWQATLRNGRVQVLNVMVDAARWSVRMPVGLALDDREEFSACLVLPVGCECRCSVTRTKPVTVRRGQYLCHAPEHPGSGISAHAAPGLRGSAGRRRARGTSHTLNERRPEPAFKGRPAGAADCAGRMDACHHARAGSGVCMRSGPRTLTWMRRLAYAVASVLVLWGLVWVAAPPLMRAQSQKRLSAALGRPVTIEAVEFKPWSMELTVRGVAIGPAPGAAASAPPLLQVARLYANGDWRSALRFAPVIANLEIDAPQMHLARTGPGRYDIDDLIERFTRPADTDTGTAERGPARFALHNLQLRDGAITFDDRPVQRRHQVTALQLSLPFLSSLPSQVEVVVQPRLSFQLGDTRVDTGAQTTPFAPDRETSMTLRMSPLDLAPLAAYLPASLPVRLQGGRAKADVSVHFEQRSDGTPALSVRGAVDADGIALTDKRGRAAGAMEGAARGAGQRAAARAQGGAGNGAFRGAAAGRHAGCARQPERRRGWPAGGGAPAASPPRLLARHGSFGVKALEFIDARVSWADATTQPCDGARSRSHRGAHRAGGVAFERARTADAAGAAERRAGRRLARDAESRGQRRRAAGEDRRCGRTSWRWPRSRLTCRPCSSLAWKALPRSTARWHGRPSRRRSPWTWPGSRSTACAWSMALPAPARDGAPRDPLSWKALEISGAKVDLATRTASIGRVALQQPRVVLDRARDGSLNVARWLVPPAGDAAASSPASAASSPGPSPWSVTLADASIDDGRLRWRDECREP